MAMRTVQLVCVIDETGVISLNEDRKMTVTFTRDIELLETDDSNELSEVHSNLLWECFDSYIVVLD